MSETFKGKQGGDPSRRPPVVEVIHHCQVCGKLGVYETRKPEFFTPPATCSSECASALTRMEAQNIIREILGDAPERGSVPQKMAVELLAAYRWMKQAEAGRVKTVQVTCAHCGKSTNRFIHATARKTKNISRFCSDDCKESSNHGLPFGVICRSPNKSSHATLPEALAVSADMSSCLLAEGDNEGVHPYQCSCGRWHVGHRSKREWLDVAREALSIMTERTVSLVQQVKKTK